MSGPTRGPLCGETNSHPSDPGTLRKGLSRSWNPAGIQQCLAEQITLETHEMEQLCGNPSEGLTATTEQNIKEAIKRALSVAKQARMIGFHLPDVNALQAEAGAAMARFLKAKVRMLGQATLYASNISLVQGAVDALLPAQRGQRPLPDQALADSIKDTLALSLQVQALGGDATAALAEVGGAFGALIDIKVDRLRITEGTLVNFPDLKLPDEELLKQLSDVLKVAQGGINLGVDTSHALSQVADALGALISRATADLKALRAKLKGDPSAEKDVLDAQIRLDLLLKAARSLGAVPLETPARAAIRDSTAALCDQLDGKSKDPDPAAKPPHKPSHKPHPRPVIDKAKEALRMRYLGDGIWIRDTGNRH